MTGHPTGAPRLLAEPAELRDLALEAARAAAAHIRERRTHGVRVADTKSSDVDVVTQPDRESEALIRRLVLERRPGDAFLGEETGAADGSSGVRWVVDPIDGTVNYLYGLPEYSVSIAVEVGGEVVAGVVVNAATGVEYVATAGDARRDGEPLGVRGPAPLHQRLVITGFGYDADKRAVQAAAVARLLPARARHPPARIVRPGPVPPRRGQRRRLRRGGREPVGLRRRRVHRCPGRRPLGAAPRGLRHPRPGRRTRRTVSRSSWTPSGTPGSSHPARSLENGTTTP